VLIITSSCGGGLLQAALAEEQRERVKDPHVRIIKRDMIRDWYSRTVRWIALSQWNGAQKKGRVAHLERLLNCQKTADLIFWPRIFFYTLRTLLKEDIDHIIDTQPLGTSAILCALSIFNRRRKKEVRLDKVVVDLPTAKNTHFFYPLKKLGKKNKKLLQLVTIPPLLQPRETAQEFWKEHCNLSEDQVRYEYFPIRQAFLRYQGVLESDISSIGVSISNHEEATFMANTIAKGLLKARFEENKAYFFFAPEDRIMTLLLGSQPGSIATLGYVQALIRVAREMKTKTPLHLFVLCGEHQLGEKSLFSRVHDLVSHVEKNQDWPKHLTVVPLSVQKEETIAPLFHRSMLTCTRSGGQTAMELMCVMRGQIWIHSEAKPKIGEAEHLSIEELLLGIPGWESGSALYLHQLHRAKIVTPETAYTHGCDLLD
jgi:hypothetical protein